MFYLQLDIAQKYHRLFDLKKQCSKMDIIPKVVYGRNKKSLRLVWFLVVAFEPMHSLDADGLGWPHICPSVSRLILVESSR
jgi:hypothetical protein